MAALVLTSSLPLVGVAWTGTAPGLPGTQTVSGTITSTSDLSVYTTQAMVDVKANMLDSTNFGSGGYHAEIPGIKSGSFGLTFNQSYTASEIDVIIRTTLGGLGSLAYIDLKATSSARGATNPSFVAAFYISDYTFLNGNVGDKNGLSVTWNTTGKFDWLVA